MRLIVGLLMLSLSVSALASENERAEPWLERLSSSLKTLNFNTSFVVVKNNQAEPYHWFHGVDEDGQELEILSILNGPRRDVLRKGGMVGYIEPELPPYSIMTNNISGPIPAILRGDITSLADSYDFISMGRNRVLGRSAQLIRIVSKDKYRLGHWLWLDQESGLLLKLAIATRKGDLLEQVQFTHLEIGPEMSEPLRKLASADLPQSVNIPKGIDKEKLQWTVNWLPKGFKKIKANRQGTIDTKQPIESMFLSDGLVDISVYINKSKEKNRASDYIHDGATVALNQVNNGYEISVVGKIPVETAEAIADSVTVSPKAQP